MWGTVLEGRVQPAPAAPAAVRPTKDSDSPGKEQPVDEVAASSFPSANPRDERRHALLLAMARRTNDAAQCSNPGAWNRALAALLSDRLEK